jgi:hypothetical protein
MKEIKPLPFIPPANPNKIKGKKSFNNDVIQ